MRQATPKLSLVLLQSRVVGHLSKWTLRVLFLLGVLLSLAAQATAAPVVFEASGEFENGWELSGTVTIDTATGKVLSADLSVTGFDVNLVFDKVAHVLDSYRGPVTGIGITGGPIVPSLGITVPGKSLVGYTGSSILSYQAGQYESYLLLGEGTYYVDEIPLVRGSLEPIE